MPVRRAQSGEKLAKGTITIPATEIAAATNSEVTGTISDVDHTENPQFVVTPRAALDAGLAIGWCRATAANTVGVGVVNATAGAITPAAAIICDVVQIA